MRDNRDVLKSLLPSCEHGVPVRDHCAECSPPAPSNVTSLMADVAKIEPAVRAGLRAPLNLPALGRHEAQVVRKKGGLIVRCSCGATVARIGSGAKAGGRQPNGTIGGGENRTKDRDRLAEEAWGQHRHQP